MRSRTYRSMRFFSISSFLINIFLSGSSDRLWCHTKFQVENEDSIKQVIQTLKSEIASEPDNPSLYLRLGHLYLSIAKWDTAMTAFRQCIQLDETSAEAYNGLGLAYHKKGETPLIPVQIIMELFKIDNYSKAEKHFKRALELRPDYLDPLYNLGVNYLAKAKYDDYQRAAETFKNLLQKDMEFRDADFMLGITYMYLKDYINAELVFKRVIEANRTVGRALLRLADVYLKTGKEEEATDKYYEGVVRLRDFEVWEEIFAELEILMEPYERNRFINLNMEEKGIFIRRFWKRKDPVPTTPKNERLIEHFRRVDFARNTYPDVIPPYYDDRGKVYVKYGPPDSKYTTQMLADMIKDNESWSYEKSIRRGMTFDFVKRGVGYYQAQTLADAAPAGLAGGVSQWEIARQLYVERADFTESYNMFLILSHKQLGESYVDGIAEIRNVMINFNAERDSAHTAAPAEVYHHDQVEKVLPFVYNLSQFRSTNGKSRIEIYIGVSNNQLKYLSVEDGMATALKCHAVLQDSDYVDVHNEAKEIALRARSIEELRGTLFLHQENIYINPGQHLLAIQLENPQGKSKGVYRNEFKVRDFRGDSLMVSDIQLSSDISSTGDRGKFVKRKLKLIPYPYTVIRRKRPIFVYMEIYNLKFNAAGRTDYTVTHQVDILAHKRGFFSKTFGAIGRFFTKGKKLGISTSYQQSKTESETSEYLSLDMGKLPVGIARLTISVQDNTSGEAASRSVRLQLIE